MKPYITSLVFLSVLLSMFTAANPNYESPDTPIVYNSPDAATIEEMVWISDSQFATLEEDHEGDLDTHFLRVWDIQAKTQMFERVMSNPKTLEWNPVSHTINVRDGGILSINTDTWTVTVLVDDASIDSFYGWSSDYANLAYTKGGYYWVYNVETQTSTILRNDTGSSMLTGSKWISSTSVLVSNITSVLFDFETVEVLVIDVPSGNVLANLGSYSICWICGFASKIQYFPSLDVILLPINGGSGENLHFISIKNNSELYQLEANFATKSNDGYPVPDDQFHLINNEILFSAFYFEHSPSELYVSALNASSWEVRKLLDIMGDLKGFSPDNRYMVINPFEDNIARHDTIESRLNIYDLDHNQDNKQTANLSFGIILGGLLASLILFGLGGRKFLISRQIVNLDGLSKVEQNAVYSHFNNFAFLWPVTLGQRKIKDMDLSEDLKTSLAGIKPYKFLLQPIRLALMKALSETLELSVPQISEILDISLHEAHNNLKPLRNKGYIEVDLKITDGGPRSMVSISEWGLRQYEGLKEELQLMLSIDIDESVEFI